jgi:hypothetical protein
MVLEKPRSKVVDHRNKLNEYSCQAANFNMELEQASKSNPLAEI